MQASYDQQLTKITLSPPDQLNPPPVDLKKVIETRTSVRNYSSHPLTLFELTYLLWSTQGVKKNLSGKATFRTVPSAGARHAVETYILINRVSSLAPGIYRYLALEHSLLEISDDQDCSDKITKGGLEQEMIRNSAATFIWVAIPYRMTWRYQERGYRYLFLDAGHVCQNLYLSALQLNCGVCAIAAFDDDKLNYYLNLDGKSQFVIYMASVGKLS